MSFKDDGTINLRGDKDEAEFRINNIEEESREVVGNISAVAISESEVAAIKPFDKVKVKFDKFVNLIATHAYEEVFDKHTDDDIIISTDLLTDLANAHEEKEGSKKGPLLFVVGILLGVAVMWIIFKM